MEVATQPQVNGNGQPTVELNTADTSMDIDMDLDLGPLPDAETIESVGTLRNDCHLS